jgi:hypothetical protein
MGRALFQASGRGLKAGVPLSESYSFAQEGGLVLVGARLRAKPETSSHDATGIHK